MDIAIVSAAVVLKSDRGVIQEVRDCPGRRRADARACPFGRSLFDRAIVACRTYHSSRERGGE